jgi:hypothetical protein
MSKLEAKLEAEAQPIVRGAWARRLRLLGLALAGIAGAAGYAPIMRLVVLPHFPGGIDFYTVWKAAQTLFVLHHDPYSQQVTREIQQAIYGHALASPEGEYLFVYPLYFLVLVFPLAWLSFPDALAAWLALLQVGSIVLLSALLHRYGLGRRPLSRALYLLWALLLFPTLDGFWLGQPAALVFVLFGLGWWAFWHQHDWAAGICLGLLLIKLYSVALPLGFLLLVALRQRRFRVILGCLGTSIFLLASSFLIDPGWLPGFLRNSAEWVNTTEVLSHDASVLQLFTDLAGAPLGSVLLIGASALSSALLLSLWVQALRTGGEVTERVLMMTLLFQAALLPHQHIPNQMLLLLPGLYVLGKLQAQSRYLLLALSLMSLLLLPWAIRLLATDPFAGGRWVIVPIPLLLSALLLVTERADISTTEHAPVSSTPANLSYLP